MTATLRSRFTGTAARATEDLSGHGIHRDPANHDPIASGGFAQKLVHKASAMLAGRTTTRRSFLTKTAVIGSALAVSPFDFILKPGTAYAYTCGTCSDGWTAFCCTINNGSNTCPPGSFIAGWWKADNAAYCCGKARYIIDCNATCPTQCSCRCAGGNCDNRRTCCNQFRYGQCHQEISCYGPVVCRVATCTVPWQYDPSCTTASATDNRTVEHGAPCLTVDCGKSAIEKKYDALGGAGGFLGSPTGPEQAISGTNGRRRRYVGGNIYWAASTGAREVHGGILTEYDQQGGPTGALGFPTFDTRTSGDERTRYSDFQSGRIYYFRNNGDTVAIRDPYFSKHQSLGGVNGYLGYPVADLAVAPAGVKFQQHERGRLYGYNGRVTEVHGDVYDYHEANGSYAGSLGVPVTDLIPTGDNRGKTQWFQRAIIWYSPTTGTEGLRGDILNRFIENDNVRGYLRYPTSSVRAVGDGIGSFATFERGHIYASSATKGFEVHGAVLDAYLANGGPTGVLEYPVTELLPVGDNRGKTQWFQGGMIWYSARSGGHALWGAVSQRFLDNGNVRNYIGYPTSSVTPIGDGRGQVATFERGNIYATPTTGGHDVHGSVLTFYLANGGPTGSLGYPTSELDGPGGSGPRYQQFEGGRLAYANGTTNLA